MPCSKCQSKRVCAVTSKANDLHIVSMRDSGNEHQGYLPRDIGIGGGDYVRFAYCLDCGTIQGKFPIPQTELEGDPDAQ